MERSIPLPPIELAARVGGRHANSYEDYEAIGRRMRDEIVRTLPSDWSFEDKTVLDFGCGAGRTLRHFVDVADRAVVYGCDIDRPSIEWLQANLSPPLRPFLCHESPPLDLPDCSVDLIWAVSVFTHLTDTWSMWLAELHRILAVDGLLLATFIGRGAAHQVTDVPWDDARIGMNVVLYDQGWDAGGPMVLHSPWWLREHWGRAFDFITLREDGFATIGDGGQGVVLLRKRGSMPATSQLERIDPGEPREIAALQHQIAQFRGQLREANAARAAAAPTGDLGTAPGRGAVPRPPDYGVGAPKALIKKAAMAFRSTKSSGQ